MLFLPSASLVCDSARGAFATDEQENSPLPAQGKFLGIDEEATDNRRRFSSWAAPGLMFMHQAELALYLSFPATVFNFNRSIAYAEVELSVCAVAVGGSAGRLGAPSTQASAGIP